MRNRALPLQLAIALILFAFTASGQRTSGERFASGELLVKFKGGGTSKHARDANRAMRSLPLEELGDLGWQRVRLPAGVNLDAAIEEYRALEGVEQVQPNFYYRLQLTPNDSSWGTLWGMVRISAPAAWDLSTGSSNIVVANIDTGVRYTHVDLAANMWRNPGEIPGNSIDDDGNGFVDDYYGYDFRYNDSDPLDENGHGTHTSGTIGAVGNNGTGVTGVSWNVRIMAIKIYSADTSDTTSAMLINAYNYVRMMKNRGVNIRITNNSYGGCQEACSYDQATKDAIDALGDAGVLNVFAAGNAGTNNDNSPFYPSSYTSPSIVAVAASNLDDNNLFNWGLSSVDLAAPGGPGIWSTYNTTDTSYIGLQGTSMATPHVSGAAALLMAHNPNLSAASVKATLMNTVDQLPQWSSLVKSGGRLNVDRALRNQTVCSFAPTSSLITVPTKGGAFSTVIPAAPNCDYAVKSNNSWIKVTTPDIMSGSGMVIFRVTVNPTITRTGTIRIGDQTLTVKQSRS